MRRASILAIACIATAAAACTPIRPLDPADAGRDGGMRDAGAADAGADDAGVDAGCDPTAPDVCNGIDDDCNPSTEDGSGDDRIGAPCDGPDSDLCTEGTYGACAAGELACSDASDDTLEVCDLLNVDEDCDGESGEADAVGARTFFADADGDGFGDDSMTIVACQAPGTSSTRGGDCDDGDPNVRPGRNEQCNAIDDDCNGMIDDRDPCSDGCETGSFGGHTYQFCSNSRPWESARLRCEESGYHLVTIETTEENDWLMAQSRVHGIGNGIAGEGVWIGLRDVLGELAWTDGSAPTFTDWAAMEPNQMACARIRPNTTLDWADYDCAAPFDWICETP